jgi:hypothetical protein
MQVHLDTTSASGPHLPALQIGALGNQTNKPSRVETKEEENVMTNGKKQDAHKRFIEGMGRIIKKCRELEMQLRQDGEQGLADAVGDFAGAEAVQSLREALTDRDEVAQLDAMFNGPSSSRKEQ